MTAPNLLHGRVRISVSDPWEFQFHHPSVLYGEIVDGKQTDTARPFLTVKLDQPLTTENSAFPNIFARPRHQGKDLAELAAGENVPFNFSTATDGGDLRLAGKNGLAFIGAMQLAEYAREDLTIISDAIAHVRRNPALYLGNLPVSGEVIAARLASDIIQSNHLPLTVYRNDDWWVVAAGTDWIGHEAVEQVFSSISSTQELGANSFGAEILVASFARNAFTCDSSGMKWITGDDVMLPRDLGTAVGGRLVAFRMRSP